MKIVSLILIALMMTACSGGSGGSSPVASAPACDGMEILGTFSSDQGYNATIANTCTITTDVCEDSIRFSAEIVPRGTTGYATLTYESNNGGPTCASIGSYDCTYFVTDADNFILNCGGGNEYFTRN